MKRPDVAERNRQRAWPPLTLDLLAEMTEVVDGCTLWTGPLHRDGYAKWKRLKVHRWVYEQLVGPIPEGRDIDHLCHTSSCQLGRSCPHRRCLDPTHLQPATRAKNVLKGSGLSASNARKTHCLNGHPLSGSNLYIRPNGERFCRQCGAERMRAWRRRDPSR